MATSPQPTMQTVFPLLNPNCEVPPTQRTNNSTVTSKYTFLNFLPKSLFEQFRRLANVYFLVLSGLMMIGTYAPKAFDSPLTPYSTFVPLVVVLLFSMAKEAYEDLKRHITDAKTNSRETTRRIFRTDPKPASPRDLTLSPPTWLQGSEERLEPIKWADIRKGHIIRIFNKEPLPADLIVLNTDDPVSGICYVETSNIDGETNLKMKKALFSTSLPENLSAVECDLPNGNIHNFTGVCKFNDEEEESRSIDFSSFLLRGSTLQNVKYIDGLVVYVGSESKLAINNAKHGPRLKLSSVEKTMNRLIQMVLGFLVLLVSLSVLLKLSWAIDANDFSYLKGSGDYFHLPTSMAYFFTFLILYSNALPMSLYVTVEMVNVGQAYFIDQDLEMYDSKSQTSARSVTSNLNSDLGQVEFLFSDKTGTLTKNEMTLKRVLVNGKMYGPKLFAKKNGSEANAVPELEALMLEEEENSVVRNFLTCLSVCHTVQISNENGDKGNYRAESPDELALCLGAKDRFKRVLTHRSGNESLTVNEEVFEILAVNDFTSKRKRMSILFRLPNGNVVLFCKGADSAFVGQEMDLLEFANEGLRTLVFAQKQVSESTCQSWLKEFSCAKNALGEDRDVQLEAIANKMEDSEGMEILGATAIEDELQDGVPETLQALRDAGIRILVLTGDKLETAVNIGYSAKLLDASMTIVRIEGTTKEAVRSQLESILNLFPHASRPSFTDLTKRKIKRAAKRWWRSFQGARAANESTSASPLLEEEEENGSLQEIEEEDESLALAITGAALEHLLSSSEMRASLLSLVLMCKTVLCCRVSPSQKAQMVRLVKKGAGNEASLMPSSIVTMAIGDGANDCAMISEAQIGVGISGKEGLQAVNASDFAISQFRFLKPLLLVHGRWSYRRMSKVILYSLYKNLVLVLLLFYYQFYCAFSGQSLFEPMVQAGFNFFLGMCPFAVGLFDREISRRFALLHPQLYVSGRKNLNLNLIKLGWRVFESLVHSLLLFFLPLYALKRGQNPGKSDLYTVGLTMYTCLIFVLQFKIVFEGSSLTRFNLYAWLFSFALYFGFLFAYNVLYWEAPEFYYVAFVDSIRPDLWFLVLVCLAAVFLFDASVKLVRLMFVPQAVDILVEQDRLATFVLTQGKRESVLPNLNHYELVQRLQTLTGEDLQALGISTRLSSFDFAVPQRLQESSGNNNNSASNLVEESNVIQGAMNSTNQPDL